MTCSHSPASCSQVRCRLGRTCVNYPRGAHEIERETMAAGWLPCGHGREYIEGPSGGAAQNIWCPVCETKYNVMFFVGHIMLLEVIWAPPGYRAHALRASEKFFGKVRQWWRRLGRMLRRLFVVTGLYTTAGLVFCAFNYTPDWWWLVLITWVALLIYITAKGDR